LVASRTTAESKYTIERALRMIPPDAF